MRRKNLMMSAGITLWRKRHRTWWIMTLFLNNQSILLNGFTFQWRKAIPFIFLQQISLIAFLQFLIIYSPWKKQNLITYLLCPMLEKHLMNISTHGPTTLLTMLVCTKNILISNFFLELFLTYNKGSILQSKSNSSITSWVCLIIFHWQKERHPWAVILPMMKSV